MDGYRYGGVSVKIGIVFALIFCGCSPDVEIVPSPAPDGGSEDASAEDSGSDAKVCDLNQTLTTCTDGAWMCDMCECAGQVCRSVHNDGTKTEGVCNEKLECSVPCPSVLCAELADGG